MRSIPIEGVCPQNMHAARVSRSNSARVKLKERPRRFAARSYLFSACSEEQLGQLDLTRSWSHFFAIFSCPKFTRVCARYFGSYLNFGTTSGTAGVGTFTYALSFSRRPPYGAGCGEWTAGVVVSKTPRATGVPTRQATRHHRLGHRVPFSNGPEISESFCCTIRCKGRRVIACCDDYLSLRR